MGEIAGRLADAVIVTDDNPRSEDPAAIRHEICAACPNAEEIGGVKRSLDRDYYNFELQRNGGVMKVFSVSMQLKNTDFKNQRYHVEIVADGRRLNKKRVNINEPIFFYVEGQKKPYEILVNRVDKKFVVGYLSVPKT